MSALNHVITWDPKTNNWIRVKAAEASKNCGMRTISAQQRIFVCELCKQYVLLTRGDGKRAPHFRHNRAEEDKNCPEHSIGSHPITYDPSDYSLPFKLGLAPDGSLRFLLGLIAPGTISEEDRLRLRKESVTIRPVGFSSERIAPTRYQLDYLLKQGITYVSVGASPRSSYELTFSDGLYSWLRWPHRVAGVKRSGTIFDAYSGKRVPGDGDVIVGKEYWLLISDEWSESFADGIQCETVPLRGIPLWKLYRVRATSFSQEAACFFLKFKLRLTESPVSLFPLWPMTVKRPYAIGYEAPRLIFYSTGTNVTNKIYPENSAKIMAVAPRGSFRLVEVKVQRHGLMISAGRTNVLKYAFLRQEKLLSFSLEDEKDILQLTDAEGKVINQEKLDTQALALPEGRINVCLKYEGSFDIEVNGFLIERLDLGADNVRTIHLPKNCRCRVRAGRDEVCSFEVRSKSTRIREVNYLFDKKTIRKKLKASEQQSQQLIPLAFAPKISRILGDCPELTAKLRNGTLSQSLVIFSLRKNNNK